MNRVRNLLVVVVFAVISFFSGTAMGQDFQKQRRIEEEKRKTLEKTELKILEGEQRLIFDYGGWINFRYDDYEDDDNDSSTGDSLDYTNSGDCRFWIKASLQSPDGANQHSLYMRFKDLVIDRRPEDINGGYDHDGPHLDYGYLVLDFRPYWLEIGRRYFSVGQGISYSNVNDGAELIVSLENWNFKTLISRTLPHEDNIDTSVPGWEKKSERNYYGIEGTYLRIPNHGIYGYLLIERDDSNEDPEDISHDFAYDSEYIGIGSQGKLLPGMHYWAEIIRETGKSFVYTTREEKNIDAWAGDFGITYDLDIYSHPNLSVEYAFGSGDSDRANVTDTQDGNTSGKDTNFLYFGYLPSGYALSPRLSNIHFYKIAALLKPLEKFEFFRNLSFGIDYYLYYKDKKDGGIYDTDATVNDNDIGSELDLTISWQILSDLTLSLEYGHFKPGDAYPASANDSEEYFNTSVTITF